MDRPRNKNPQSMLTRFVLLFIFAAVAPGLLPAQPEAAVEVCDLTLRLKGDDVQDLYYGFAAGDRLVFRFEETGGLAIARVEIAEYPDQLRFQELETALVEEKVIYVQRSGVFRFRFANDRREKNCKVTIQRIPGSAQTRGFRTAVRWVEQYDTVYQDRPAQMETRQVERRRWDLVRVDTAVVNLIDKKERVHSRGNFHEESSSVVKVSLPKNYEEPGRTYEVISWAYWIGVGEEAEGQYREANRTAKLAKSATNAVKNFGILAGPYGALASLAIDGVSFFLPPGKGDNVQYEVRAGGKLVDQGDGPAAFARHGNYTQGEVQFKLSNDNLIDAVDVSLRVMAVAAVKTYKESVYLETQEAPVVKKEITLKKVPALWN